MAEKLTLSYWTVSGLKYELVDKKARSQTNGVIIVDNSTIYFPDSYFNLINGKLSFINEDDIKSSIEFRTSSIDPSDNTNTLDHYLLTLNNNYQRTVYKGLQLEVDNRDFSLKNSNPIEIFM